MSYFTLHPVSGKVLMDVRLHLRSDPSHFDDFFLLNYKDFIAKIETASLSWKSFQWVHFIWNLKYLSYVSWAEQIFYV